MGRLAGLWFGRHLSRLLVRFADWQVGWQIGRLVGRFKLKCLHINSLASGQIVKYKKLKLASRSFNLKQISLTTA